jgi:hypothetical protein
MPHSTVGRVNAVNKRRRGKYQFMKKIILGLGFRIYLLGHLEKQLIKYQMSNIPSKKNKFFD